MSLFTREIYYVMVVALVAVVLQAVTPLLSLVLTLPALFVFTVSAPVVYLVIIAVSAELLTVLPGGVMAIAIFTPWLVRLITRAVSVDVSFSFFLVVVGAVGLQFMVMFTPDIWFELQQQSFSLRALGSAILVVPWKISGLLLVPVIFIYVTSIFVHYNR